MAGYTDPTTQPPQPTAGGGNWVWDAAKGLWSWLSNNSGAALGTAGQVAGDYISSQDRAKALAEQAKEYEESLKQRQAEAAQSADQFKQTLADQAAARAQSGEQFGRTTGDTEAQAAVRAQTQLNAAPLADKAQALILARMGVAPGAFQPRDYTKGTSDLSRSYAAPGADVSTALQKAATGYTPGSGGVDTSVLKALLSKLVGSSGLSVPDAPAGVNGFPAPSNPISNGPTPPDVRPRMPSPTLPAPGVPSPRPPVATPTLRLPPVATSPGDVTDTAPVSTDPMDLIRRRLAPV